MKSRLKEETERLRQWLVEAGLARGQCNYLRFIILCDIRTGSTMLTSYLASHPNVRMLFEPFHIDPHLVPFNCPGYRKRGNHESVAQLRNEDPVSFLHRHIFTRQPRRVQALGFKLLYTQAQSKECWWDSPKYHHWWEHVSSEARLRWRQANSDLWDCLQKDRDLAVIHLTRRNQLHAIVSAELAKQSGHWGGDATGGFRELSSPPLAYVKTRHLLVDLAATERKQREATAFFAHHRILQVVYEDLVAKPGEWTAEILNFLRLPPFDIFTRTRKQERRPLAMCIRNFAEVSAVLRGTPWQRLLD